MKSSTRSKMAKRTKNLIARINTKYLKQLNYAMSAVTEKVVNSTCGNLFSMAYSTMETKFPHLLEHF